MIVITGAAGLVGGNLARALLADGHTIRGLIHNDRRAVEGLNIQLVKGDLRDPASLRRAFKDAEIVYHLAASISLSRYNWPLMEAINVTGTRNVVEACITCGVRRLIHISSIHAIQQEPFDQPLDESRPLALSPKHPPYDRSKALAELEIQKGIQRGLDAVIINPTAIVGPNDFKPSYFGRAVIAIAEGRVPALVQGGFDWVDVRDVVAGTIAAAQLAPTGAKYLLSGHWHSLTHIARQIAALTGCSPPRLTLPLWLAYLGLPVISALSSVNGKDPLYTRFSLQTLKSNQHISHAHAAHTLNYKPRPFEETLAETIKWFSHNGHLNV